MCLQLLTYAQTAVQNVAPAISRGAPYFAWNSGDRPDICRTATWRALWPNIKKKKKTRLKFTHHLTHYSLPWWRWFKTLSRWIYERHLSYKTIDLIVIIYASASLQVIDTPLRGHIFSLNRKKHSIETFWNENKLLVTFTTIFWESIRETYILNIWQIHENINISLYGKVTIF